MTYDCYEALFEFNKSIRLSLLALDGLTRQQGFDPGRLNQCVQAISEAKAATNAYLISVIGSNEAAGQSIAG